MERTNTEVISFDTKSTAPVRRGMRGMVAFALWDDAATTLFTVDRGSGGDQAADTT